MRGWAHLECRLAPTARAVPAGLAAQDRLVDLRVPWGLVIQLHPERPAGRQRPEDRGDPSLLSGQRDLAGPQALADPGHLAVQQDQEVPQVPRAPVDLQVLAALVPVGCIPLAQPLRRLRKLQKLPASAEASLHEANDLRQVEKAAA